MSNTADLWAKFRAHNWETDEKWQDVLRQIENGSIEFPSGNKDDILQKMKYKHFKRYVEPEFDPNSYPKYSDTTSNQPRSSSSSANTQRSSGPTNANSNQSQEDRQITHIKLIWYGAQLFSLVNMVLHFIPLVGSSHSAYYRALYGAFTAYLLSLYKSVGVLRLNQESAARVLMNDNAHYLLLCIGLCLSAPSSISLIPLSIYAILHISSFTSNNASIFPAPVQPLITRLQPLFLKALNNQQQLLISAASFEFFALLNSFVAMLFGNGPLPVIAFYWFLNLRYIYSPNSRIALDAIGYKLDGILLGPSSPSFVQTAYTAVRNFLRRGVQRYQV